jgi:lipid II:glycine glycyltransferase (peptidoglycan interpeptide bridge formation enzyme)
MDWTDRVDEGRWDAAVAAENGHFLQTSHWAEFQRRLGRPVFFAEHPTWRCMAVLEVTRTGTRLYCPYGPMAATADGLRAALAALRDLAAEQGAMFVRVEPVTGVDPAGLPDLGLKPAFTDIQPRLGWVLDLDRPLDAVLGGMTKTNRNLYRNHQKKDLALRISLDPSETPIFVSMMQEVAERNGIVAHPAKYYRTMAETLMPRDAGRLYFVEHAGEPVAASLCFDHAHTRFYAHAASRYAARKVHPGTVLLAAMIVDAHERRQKAFDFIGVAPADAPDTHPWAGLTKFKQSYGGDYRPWAGTWELPVQRMRYSAYRAAYAASKAVR